MVNLRPGLKFLLPVFITLLAGIIQKILWPYAEHFGFLLFYPAVFLSSWIDGKRGALVSTFLSALIVLIVFIPPEFSIDVSDSRIYLSLFIFISIGLLMGFRQENLSKTITKLTVAENDLIESEHKYRRIVETAQEGIVVATQDGTFTYVNRKFAEILGYEVEEMLGHNGKEFIHPDELNHLDPRRSVLKNGDKIQDIMRFISKDGREIWTLFNATPILDEKGEFSANLATHTDITERKKMEDELAYRESVYTRMVSRLPKSIICVLDRERMIIQCRGGKLMEMNINSKELEGKPLIDLVTSEASGILDQSFLKALSGEEASCETIFRNVYWQNDLVPVPDQEGNIGNILLVSVDITKQKQTETELRFAQKKLNLTLKNANIGTWEWDLKTNEMIWDERMEKIFDLGSGSSGGTYQLFESCINEEDVQHFRDSVNSAIRSDNPLETVFRTRTANGNSRYITSKALVSKYKNGKPVGLAGVCFDVTSMKKGTEKALIKLNEELMRSNKDLEQFAYVASHDLQEPLRMVSSFTQILEQRYAEKLDEDGREFINYAVEGSKRMYFLLNGLLAYSRVQSRGREFGKVRMNIVMEKVLKNLSLKIEEKQAVVIVKKLPVVFADDNQMIQLLQNLVENALKFSQKDSKIHISAKSDNVNHIFSVKDEGIGIEPQYFERIFKIFQRLSRNYEGTGIGLAICKRIVERHGGTIRVESTPGKGSNFIFTIPKIKALSVI